MNDTLQNLHRLYGNASDLLQRDDSDEIVREVLSKYSCNERSAMEDVQLVILKPDAVSSGKALRIAEFLVENDIAILWAKPIFNFNKHQYEELYRFNIGTAHQNSMVGKLWILRQPFELNLSILLLVKRMARSAHESSFQKINKIKGSSTPYDAQKGQIRYDFIGCSYVLNLIHASDDPISSLREISIFCDDLEVRDIIERIKTIKETSGECELSNENLNKVQYICGSLGPPSTDADLSSAYVRLIQKTALFLGQHGLVESLYQILGALPRHDHRGPRVKFKNTFDKVLETSLSFESEIDGLHSSLPFNAMYAAEVIRDVSTWNYDIVSNAISGLRNIGIPISDWDSLILLTNAEYASSLTEFLNVPKVWVETQSSPPQDCSSQRDS